FAFFSYVTLYLRWTISWCAHSRPSGRADRRRLSHSERQEELRETRAGPRPRSPRRKAKRRLMRIRNAAKLRRLGKTGAGEAIRTLDPNLGEREIAGSRHTSQRQCGSAGPLRYRVSERPSVLVAALFDQRHLAAGEVVVAGDD